MLGILNIYLTNILEIVAINYTFSSKICIFEKYLSESIEPNSIGNHNGNLVHLTHADILSKTFVDSLPPWSKPT